MIIIIIIIITIIMGRDHKNKWKQALFIVPSFLQSEQANSTTLSHSSLVLSHSTAEGRGQGSSCCSSLAEKVSVQVSTFHRE
jgi:hypothetical protein